jgi:flagellar motility protein MotE (MotC chaperone)
MKSLLKHIRLLPVVVIVGTGLLAIKGVDIARAAQNVAASDADQPDDSGLAPSMPTSKPTQDFADDDTSTGSAGEADVLTSLTKRRAELDARERGLTMRENLLGAGEARVDQKIAALRDLQTQIQGLLAQRDAKQDAQIASLVKTYSAMKPKDAARIFNTLSDDVLIPVAKGMKSDVLAPVMASMNPDAAQKLTVKLAALLKLPESAPGAICPTPATTTAADAATPSLASPVVTPLPNTGNPPVTPLQTAAVMPTPAAAPAPAPAPTAAPAQTPPAQPAKPAPIKPAPRHVAAKPAPVKPAATTPKPAMPAATPAAAPPAAKPVTIPAATPAMTPAPSTTAPATAAPATTAPAKPPAATGAPTTLTPTPPAPTK